MKSKRKSGKVVLVGAGPGDAGLLTLRGADWLRRSEVVVYDWLANPELLGLAPKAEKVFAGKKGGTTYRDQSEINQILVKFARKGRLVVRLKGGDPFVFGRGGEEAESLRKHGIPYEVVPGVSAGIGAPAYAGIPLTDRRSASQVTFVTGCEDPAKKSPSLNWPGLAQTDGTLVFFMGVRTLPQMVRSLLTCGKSPRTPAAVIEWGTFPRQRVVEGTLADIVQKAGKSKVGSPALTVIGEVVRLRKKLAWFEKKPLRGKTVVVTRARAQASGLVKKLREEGAQVFEFPVIEIKPPAHPEQIDREIRLLAAYDWVVFTSINGVHSFFERIQRAGKDARIFSGVRVAAIGEATERALAEKGIKADRVPKDFTSRALFEALKKAGGIRGRKFLLARADIAPGDLKQALKREGGRVTELAAYRTRRGTPRGTVYEPSLPQLIQQNKIDYITFTSSSTVDNFFASLPKTLHKRIGARFVSIGPVTSRTLRSYGFRPYREARVHTIEGLVEAICNGCKGNS